MPCICHDPPSRRSALRVQHVCECLPVCWGTKVRIRLHRKLTFAVAAVLLTKEQPRLPCRERQLRSIVRAARPSGSGAQQPFQRQVSALAERQVVAEPCPSAFSSTRPVTVAHPIVVPSSRFEVQRSSDGRSCWTGFGQPVNRESTPLDAQKRYSSNCGNLDRRPRNTRTLTGVSFAVGTCATSFARGRNYPVATLIYRTAGGLDQFVATVRATRSAIAARR